MQNIVSVIIVSAVTVIVVIALMAIVREFWADRKKRSPHTSELFSQPGKIIASFDYDKEILSTLDKIFVSIEKSEDNEKKHRAGVEIVLEEIAGYLKKQNSIQDRTSLALQKLVSQFDGGVSGYTDMTDEEASIREKATRYERTYGISHDEAMRRARNDAIYQSNSGGMGGSV